MINGHQCRLNHFFFTDADVASIGPEAPVVASVGQRSSTSVILSVCLSARLNQNGLNQNRQTWSWHRDSPSRYLSHQWIKRSKVKVTESKSSKLLKVGLQWVVATRQPCGIDRLVASMSSPKAAQRDGSAWPSRRATTQPCRTNVSYSRRSSGRRQLGYHGYALMPIL